MQQVEIGFFLRKLIENIKTSIFEEKILIIVAKRSNGDLQAASYGLFEIPRKHSKLLDVNIVE